MGFKPNRFRFSACPDAISPALGAVGKWQKLLQTQEQADGWMGDRGTKKVLAGFVGQEQPKTPSRRLEPRWDGSGH